MSVMKKQASWQKRYAVSVRVPALVMRGTGSGGSHPTQANR
jgi:hypothetical protein